MCLLRKDANLPLEIFVLEILSFVLLVADAMYSVPTLFGMSFEFLPFLYVADAMYSVPTAVCCVIYFYNRICCV